MLVMRKTRDSTPPTTPHDQFLKAWAEPVAVSDESDTLRVIATAANILFGGSKSANVLDLNTVREAIRVNVFQKKLRGRWLWLDILDHVGTHHPKTQNDKVPTLGLIARTIDRRDLPPHLLWSGSTDSGRAMSCAGNGALISHYKFLALAIRIGSSTRSLIEWVAEGEQSIWNAMIEVGFTTDLLNQLRDGWDSSLAARKQNALARELKQIFVPIPSGGNQHTLMTPLASSQVISAFMQRRSKLADGEFIYTRVTSIGGTKFQNAGQLMNDLGGKLPHFSMGFPKRGQGILLHALFRLQRQVFDMTKSDHDLDALERKLKITWAELPLPRATMKRSLELTVARILEPRLLALSHASELWREAEDQERVSEKERGAYSRLPRILQDCMKDFASLRQAHSDTHLELREWLVNAILFKIDLSEDSVRRLVDETVERALVDFEL